MPALRRQVGVQELDARLGLGPREPAGKEGTPAGQGEGKGVDEGTDPGSGRVPTSGDGRLTLSEHGGRASAAEAEIRSRIDARGKIPFREFMELALYFPAGRGYYAGPGARARTQDYYTSPAAHPAFGAAIAILLRSMWRALGRPAPFVAVELGAGGGLLARDAVDYAAGLDGDFSAALEYEALELGERAPRAVTGCVLSNELVDAMPVARYAVAGGRVMEVFVGVDGAGALCEVLSEPVTRALAARFGRGDHGLPEGARGEVREGVGPWMERVAGILGRGFALTIDYGGTADELRSRSAGTLQTHYRHVGGLSPYQNVGMQDITAHVDFTELASEGARSGLRPLGLVTQREMLGRCGIDRISAQLGEILPRGRDLAANLRGVDGLTRPDGLGGFRALLQERGTGIESLERVWPAPPELERLPAPPVLGPEHLRLADGGAWPAHLEVDSLWPWDESG